MSSDVRPRVSPLSFLIILPCRTQAYKSMDPSSATTTCATGAVAAESPAATYPHGSSDLECGPKSSENSFRKKNFREAKSRENQGWRKLIRNFTPS